MIAKGEVLAPDLFKEKLQAPFPEDCIEWRLAQAGKNSKGFWAKCLAYLQSRAIMDRLDDVVGPMGWKIKYRIESQGVIGELSLWNGGEWVTKEDGAEPSDIEPFKGAISGALKRAAVPWGIGRYTYNLDEAWAEIVPQGTKGSRYGQTKEKETFYWVPPKLPAWALPGVATKSIPKGHPVGERIALEGDGKRPEIKPKEETITPAKAEKIMISANGNNWNRQNVLDVIKAKWGASGLREIKESDFDDLIAIVSKRRPEIVLTELEMLKRAAPENNGSGKLFNESELRQGGPLP